MVIRLSDREASILLGATLMHWGVPFRFTAKRELSPQEQASIDQASEKLIALRQRHLAAESEDAEEVILSEDEFTLLILVVEDCLAECGSDSTELRLQLHTDDRSEVEALLGRLRQTVELAPRT